MSNQGVDYRVIELGANHAGEIAYTCRIVLPEIAILNNAQEAHLSGFGNQWGVVKTKGEIISGLATGGQAVLNMDDPNYSYWQQLASECPLWSFSIDDNKARVHTEQLQVGAEDSSFVLCIDDQRSPVHLSLTGRHNVANALAAAAAAAAAGLSVAQISAGLATCKAYRGRLVRHQLAADILVIDDTYNANPSSFKSVLENMKNL